MKTIYAVISMHRSGSSLLMHFLKKNNLNIGKNYLIDKSKYNIFGHYEDLDILNINTEIFKNNNTHWFNSFKKKIVINNSIKKKITKVFEKKFQENYFIFKDPKMIDLVDKYKLFLRGKFNFKLIIMHRKPINIISSIFNRNKFPIDLIYYHYSEPQFVHQLLEGQFLRE